MVGLKIVSYLPEITRRYKSKVPRFYCNWNTRNFIIIKSQDDFVMLLFKMLTLSLLIILLF